MKDIRRGGLDIGDVPGDDWVVATQLQRQNVVRRFGELAMQSQSRTNRSGKKHSINSSLSG